MGQRVTLKDVAARAAVDPSVVSRLLNKDPTLKVRAETRDRVFAAVEDLEYTPNLAARALRTSRGTLLAFVVPELTNPLYALLVQGATTRAEARGYSIVLLEHRDGSPDHRLLGTFRHRGIEGLIVAGGTIEHELVKRFEDYELPVVVVNRRIEGLPSILVDDTGGTESAARHLLDLGHRAIAHVGGPEHLETSTRRAQALRSLLRRNGANVVATTFAAGRTPEAGAQAMARILTERPLAFSAVFADSAMLGVGVLGAAAKAGLTVPDDLSVVALHDFDLAGYTCPPLTTVALPMAQLGAAAVSTLLDMGDRMSLEPIVVTDPPRLVERASTGPPPT